MAVTFTQAQIDTFAEAMNTNPGVISMSFGGRSYQFETLEKKREHLAYMQRNLAPAVAGRVRYAATSKGVR